MLKLTRRTEYGLIALVHLVQANESDGLPTTIGGAPTGAPKTGGEGRDVVSAREIADRYSVPPRFLAEVLRSLHHAGLVGSTRGAQGGYALARDPEAITLGDVVAALEGAPTLTNCEGLGVASRAGVCDVEAVCPIRSPLQRLRKGIWALLEGVTLRALADRSVDPSELFALQAEE